MKNKQKFTKIKKVLLPLSIGVILAVTPFIYLQTKKAPEVEAGWFDENWLYRQEVTIPNSGSETTNEVVSVPIDTTALISAGKMQPSCNDVRFTTATGQPLKHNYKENPIKVTNVTSTKSESAVSSISFTHTVEAGVNTALVVVYHGMKTSAGGNTFDITNATFNGDAMTEQIEYDSSGPIERDYATSIWTLANPDVGSYTVAITLGENVDSHVAAAYTVTGVDQTIVASATASNSGITDKLSLTGSTNYANSMVIGGALRRNAATFDWERLYVSQGIQAYWEENSLATTEISAAGGYAMVSDPAPASGSPIMVSTLGALSERMNGAWVELVANSPSDAYGCNTTHTTESTNFDVLIPKIRAGGEKIYMYYGNSRASSSITSIRDGTTDIDYKAVTEFESTSTTQPYTFSHDVTTGDNQTLVLMIHASNQQNPDSAVYYYADTVTFNGEPMFLQSRVESYITGENLSTEIWVLPNPDVVNGTVSITFSATIDRVMAAAMTFENVQQNLFPNEKVINSTTSGSSLALTLTTPSSNNYVVGGGVIEYATGSASTLTGLDVSSGETETYTDETGTDNTIDIQGVGGFEIVNLPSSETLDITPTSGSTHHINGAAITLEPVYFKYFTPTDTITTSEEKGTGPSGFWKFDEGASNTCTGGTADACDTTNNANDAIVSDAAMWKDAKYCISDSCLYFDGSTNVAAVYQHATPVAAWQFEDQTGIKASDSSGNDNSLTLNAGSWTTSGKWNGAWDGTGSVWMSRADDSDFDFTTTDSFTISGWFKRSATSTQEYILAKEETTGADGGYRVSMESDGDILCGVDTDNASFPLDSVTSTAATYDDGNWHHFACVKNTSTDLTLYIDGTSIATDSSLTGTGTYANDDPLVIGDHTGVDGGNEFAGDLDDIRIYNTALNTNQLTALYSTGLAQSNMIDFDKNLAAGSTIETWFKVSSDGENSTGEIYDKGTNNYARVTNEGSDNLGDLEVKMDLATDATFTSANAVTLNKWHHLAVTYTDDGDDEITVYLDGKNLGSSTDGVGVPGTDTSDLLLGGDSSNNFHGFIDEFKIYAYERSAEEVKTDFLKNSTKSGSSVSAGFQDQDFLNQNLVGYWTMDDSAGDATDTSGNSLTLTNTNSATYAAGKFSNSVDVNGSSQYLYSADNADLSITGTLTISAWLNPDTVTGSQSVIGKWDGANESYLLSLNGSAIRFSIDSASTYGETSSGAIATGSYQHVVAVYLPGSQNVEIYVNGQKLSVTLTGTIPSSIGDDAGRFNIGAEDTTGGSPTAYYNGKLDDVRLYSRALTGNEIKTLYSWAPTTTTYSAKPSLTARWKFDELRGTTAYDSTSNANNLTLTSANWTTSAKIGSGAWDGAGSVWLSRTADADFNFTATDSFTFTGWFKRGDAGQEYILARTDATAGSYRISMEANGTIICGVDNDSSSYPLDSVTSPSGYEDSAWHHFACVKNGTANMRLYIDGVLVAEDLSLTSSGTYADDSTLYIGDYDGLDNGSEFSGDLDDLHIYRIALSEDQIKQDYNALSSYNVGVTGSVEQSQQTSGVPSSTNLKGSWNFDENTSTTLNDLSGNTNTLTASNTTWVNGKFGAGLSFNGSTSNASRVYDPDFDFAAADNFTISLWMKHNGEIATNNDYILTKVDAAVVAAGGYKIYMDLSGDLCFAIDDDATWDPEDTACTSGVDYDDNNWHHIVARKNGTSGIYLFVNSILVASDTSLNANGTLVNDGLLYIGVDSDGTSNEWDGLIDEVKIYNTALANDQISYLYERGKPAFQWRFDECEGTKIYDESPFSMDGTLTLGASGTTSAGDCETSATSSWYVGAISSRSGIDFDGTDDYVTIADASTFDTDFTEALDIADGSDFSISGWFYRDTAANDHVILAKRNGVASGDTGYIIYINDDADATGATTDDLLTLEVSDGTDEYSVVSTSAFTSTGWNHFTYVWDDDTASNMKLYINGVEDTTAAKAGTLANIGSLSNSVTTRFGSESDGANYFDGKLDDIRIYPYPLTAQQVRLIYNTGAVNF